MLYNELEAHKIKKDLDSGIMVFEELTPHEQMLMTFHDLSERKKRNTAIKQQESIEAMSSSRKRNHTASAGQR